MLNLANMTFSGRVCVLIVPNRTERSNSVMEEKSLIALAREVLSIIYSFYGQQIVFMMIAILNIKKTKQQNVSNG